MPEEKKASPQIHGPIFSELGKTGLKESNGWVYEEFLPKLRWPRAGAVYQEMSSNDPVITAIMLTAKQLIKQVTWSVTAASTKRADVHAAEFVKTCMDDMNISWAGFIDELLSYFTYGFYIRNVMEITEILRSAVSTMIIVLVGVKYLVELKQHCILGCLMMREALQVCANRHLMVSLIFL